MSPFRRLVGEAHRRSVWQVLGAYLAASWIGYEVILGLVEGVGLPESVPAFALVIFLLGLPIVLATAVVQEGAPGTARAGSSDPADASPDEDEDESDSPGSTGHPPGPRSAAAPAPANPRPAGARLQTLLTWRNALLAGVLAFALLGVGVAGYMAMRALGIGPVGSLVAKGVLDEHERVIVADFANHTPDSLLAVSVTEAFRVDLAQSEILSLVEPAQVRGVLARMGRGADADALDAELAREVAVREGIKAVLAGEIGAVGDGYVLSVRLVAAEDGRRLAAFRETAGDAGAVIEAVDALSNRLRGRIGESLRAIHASQPLAEVTTGSLEALRIYSQAVRAIDAEADDETGISLLEEAIALDTAFAMAYRKLAIVLSNRGEDRERQIEALETALRHSDRLTERERYHTEATYHSVLGDSEAAINAYRTLLSRYPEDGIALNNLAVRYRETGDFERAEELYRRALALDSEASQRYSGLIATRLDLGRLEAADSTLDELRDRLPTHPAVYENALFIAWNRGDLDSAKVALDGLADRFGGPGGPMREPASFGLATFAAARGRLVESATHLEDVIDAALRRQRLASALQAALYEALLALNHRQDASTARALSDDALERFPLDSIPPLDRPYFLLVRVHALTGRPDLARQTLTEYERSVPAALRRGDASARAGAAGDIALAEGRYPDAIREYSRLLDDIGCSACALPFLARAYDLAEQTDSAISAYERYIETTSAVRFSVDALELAPALERLGQLHEQSGNRAAAAAYYARFIELWSDADAELRPRVEAATRALQRLGEASAAGSPGAAAGFERLVRADAPVGALGSAGAAREVGREAG